VRRRKDDIERDGKAKYMKLTGSKVAMFNSDLLTAPSVHTALLCAGEFDAILAQRHAPDGVACVTFGSESKSPTERWLLAMRSVRRLFIAFDNDAAGNMGASKWAHLGSVVNVPTGKDITEYWQGGGDLAAWLAALNGAPAQLSDDEFTGALIASLERMGYSNVHIGEQGQLVAI
jgi:hypothetical protein